MEDKIDLRWRKSSYSGNGGGNCVEVGVGGRVMVRDSQDRAGTVLRFPPFAWRKFADQVKRWLALDPALRVSHRFTAALAFSATGPARTLVPCGPAHLCSANGRDVWGGKEGASGETQNRPWFPARVRDSPERLSGFDLLFLAQVLAVPGTSNPVTGAAEHRALRQAVASDVGDAAHGAGQPSVVELQGPGQVGACPAVGAVPFGGQG
jgi:Domain of unknown function (DUF397)